MWTLLDGATGDMYAVESAVRVVHPTTNQPLNFTLVYTRSGVEMRHGLDSTSFRLQLPEPLQWVMLRGSMVLLQGNADAWRAAALKTKALRILPLPDQDDDEVGAVAKAAAKTAQKRHLQALKTVLRKRSAVVMPSSPVPAVLQVGPGCIAADESDGEESCGMNDDIEDDLEDAAAGAFQEEEEEEVLLHEDDVVPNGDFEDDCEEEVY